MGTITLPLPEGRAFFGRRNSLDVPVDPSMPAVTFTRTGAPFPILGPLVGAKVCGQGNSRTLVLLGPWIDGFLAVLPEALVKQDDGGRHLRVPAAPAAEGRFAVEVAPGWLDLCFRMGHTQDESPVRCIELAMVLPKLAEKTGACATLEFKVSARRDDNDPQPLFALTRANLQAVQMEPLAEEAKVGSMLGILGCRAWVDDAPESQELLAYGPAARSLWRSEAGANADDSGGWPIRGVKRGLFHLALYQERAKAFGEYAAFSLDRACSFSLWRWDGPGNRS